MELRVDEVPESNYHVSMFDLFYASRSLNEDVDLDSDAKTGHHPVQKKSGIESRTLFPGLELYEENDALSSFNYIHQLWAQ